MKYRNTLYPGTGAYKMTDAMDFFNTYIMGSIQMLTGFYFFTRFLQKKLSLPYYFLFSFLVILLIKLIPGGSIAEFLAYTLLLTASGIFPCRVDWKSSLLYAALTVEIMQLSYGVVNSLLGILYPLMSSFHRQAAGIALMLTGNTALLLAALCCHMAYRYFSCYDTVYETVKKQYMLITLTPILMIFLMGRYINFVSYGNTVDTNGSGIFLYTKSNHCLIFGIQLFGMASLFCIMFSYKKLLLNFRLNTELSLLEQEEHSLNRYVEEAKSHYEKTKSFRHDIKNHITVVKELLQNGKSVQALNYLKDMEEMTDELSFPYSTNHPVADILIGNKLGMAKSMGIDVRCTLCLPYPCSVRDIDFCIILSNALDNAIQACKNMDDHAEKYIHVTGRIQGDFLLLEIENSFRGNSLPKKGTGLSNIKTVAEKYHGAVSTITRGTSFLLSVLLIFPPTSIDSPQKL